MQEPAAPITRAQIIAAVHAALERAPEVLAAIQGGSDGNGRSDSLSDVDLVVVVEEGAVEPRALRAEMEALALPRSPDEVEAFRNRAAALFDATLAEIDRQG